MMGDKEIKVGKSNNENMLKRVIRFLKPKNIKGKIGLYLYLGGIFAFTISFAYFWNSPDANFYVGYILDIIFWLIGSIGMIIYFTHLFKNKGR
jgi:hypothetical protein